jgi:hypothetical protein
MKDWNKIMKYTIEIHYQTGDSFHTEECVKSIEPTWENLEMAKQSLKRIKNHYEYQREHCDIWSDPKKPLPEGVEWNKKYRVIMLVLIDDNGNPFYYSDFWTGHFEQLHEAKIIISQEDLGDYSYRPNY